MMSKTPVVPAVAPAAIVATAALASTRSSPSAATVAGEVRRGPVRPLFPARPRRLATGPAPAALIVVVWMLLWAWVALGVAAPLSRVGGLQRAPAVQESALRT